MGSPAPAVAPGAQFVAVKEAVDRYTALCLPPSRTGPMLREAARKGVSAAGHVPLPEPPYVCEVSFVGTSSAALAAMVPTVRRTGPRGVAFETSTVDALYRCFRVVAKLGAAATEPRYG